MALKPVYVIKGQRWLPIARAAALAGTNAATIKKWMSDNMLEWRQLRTGSKTFLASERDIIRLRAERNVVQKETAKRARATRSATQTGRSQVHQPSAAAGRPSFDVFTQTWDPATQAPPISGRAKPDSIAPEHRRGILQPRST